MTEWLWWQDFHFIRPCFLLFLLMASLYVWWLWRGNNAATEWKKLIAPHLFRALLIRDRGSLLLSPRGLVTIQAVIVALALAGPSWERKPSPFAQDKAALVVCLDVSASMNQSDVQPSRLERAKMKLRDLLALREGSRTGLVVFAGSAHTVIPLSSDRDILENFIASLSTRMMPREGKFHTRALALADGMLAAESVPGTILFLTDSASSEVVDDFENHFSGSRHQLLVLGVGDVEVEHEETSHLPLQEDILRSLAEEAGGFYQRLSIDDGDVRRLNRRINYHLSVVQEEDGTVPWEDAGYYLLFPIALLLLPWFRRGWTLQFGLLFALSIPMVQPVSAQDFSVQADPAAVAHQNTERDSTATSTEGLWDQFVALWLTPDQRGRWFFENGDYARAAESFSDTKWKATSYYYDENFAAAIELYRQMDSSEGFFHAGNALAHDRRYLEAVESYDEVLRMEPSHAGALQNRLLVQTLIDDINRMSESQREEMGEQSEELGDEPRRAEGADREVWNIDMRKTLSAEEILADQAINELWMREVQPDPSRFLGIKFRMQLKQQQSTGDEDQRK